MSSVQCPVSIVSCPLSRVICDVSCALCLVPGVLFSVLCLVSCVYSPVRLQCPVSNVPCPLSRVLVRGVLCLGCPANILYLLSRDESSVQVSRMLCVQCM